MTQNPFEAPRAPETNALPPTTGSGKFEIGQCLQEAWQAVSSNLGIAIGGTLLGMLLFGVSYVTIIGILLLIPVFAWGMVKLYLNLYDGNAEIGDLFGGFQRYGAVLGSLLLLGLCMFAIYIPGYLVMGIGVAMESSAVSGIGNLLVLILALTVVLRFYFAIFFIVDQEMGAIDAMKASWAATQDQKLATFLLALLSGLVAIVGMLAFGVGMLVSVPVSYMMFVSAYRQMVGRPA